MKYILTVVVVICFLNSLFAQIEQDKIEKVDKIVAAFSGNNPGMVVGVMNGEGLLFSKAYGLSDIESGKELEVDQKMNISSLGKYITAISVYELIDRGKIDFSTNLTDILPEFPEYGNKITIKNLLNHTSGLPNYDQTIKSNKDLISFLKSQTNTEYEPGTKFKYSNSDYPVLVSIVEEVTNRSFESFFKKYIAKKLKFKEPIFYSSIQIKQLAKGHSKMDSGYEVDKDSIENILGEHNIYMNVKEYSQFVNLLYSQKLMKQKIFNEFFESYKTPDGQDSFYSAGWTVMQRKELKYMWQAGMKDGYSHMVLHLPDDNISVIIFTNRNDSYNLLRGALSIANIFTERDVQSFFN